MANSRASLSAQRSSPAAPYMAVFGARFRMMLQYRAAALAGIGTQVFFGLIFVMVYEAFYRASSAQQPMSYPEVRTYIWLGQALLAMLPWNVDREVRDMVRSGAVGYELLRPLDLYALWYCRALAWRVAPTLLRSVPLVAVAIPFLGMGLPPSLASAGAWALSMVGALVLGCAMTTLMNISLLWTLSGEGVAQLVPVLVLVFSGMLVPLPLYPDWMQPLLNALPFRGLIDIPFRLYLGHLPPEQALPLFGYQLAWTAALVLLGRWVLARGTRRLVIQGG
jgi:ABC-2 type transport system permease protein